MPRLSVVVLTWNEERNVEACLAALARQTVRDFEVLLIDAASTDRTVERARAAAASFPVPITVRAESRRLPIGEARNLGVALAVARNVAFLSADAQPDERWADECLRSLITYDVAFGRQVHQPHRWTIGAAVRGLRYHFPDRGTREPLRYASNVAAGFRKQVLLDFPFDPWANAAEDLLLARRAHAAGHSLTYNPRMVVRHHDVATVREEWRKNAREGKGCGVYVTELGVQVPLLLWAAGLVGSVALAVAWPTWGLPLLVAVLWAPAVRRAARPRPGMPLHSRLLGVLASPAFDLSFLALYLRGLLQALARRGKGRSIDAAPAASASPSRADSRRPTPVATSTPSSLPDGPATPPASSRSLAPSHSRPPSLGQTPSPTRTPSPPRSASPHRTPSPPRSPSTPRTPSPPPEPSSRSNLELQR